MTTLVVGKNSAVGMSLEKSLMLSDLIMIDRVMLDRIMVSSESIFAYLKSNDVTQIIYLMVERDISEVSGAKKSQYNYIYPIQLWDAIQKISGATFIWVNSIFANDEKMRTSYPYLEVQNLAHRHIIDSLTKESPVYSRISFSQIYGTENFIRHQPFLYKLNSLIQNGQNVQILNAKKTKRNFINIDDVCSVLTDSQTWLSMPNVSCVPKQTFSWWDIAQAFKAFYDSDSMITDVEENSRIEDRTYSIQGLNDISTFYNLRDLPSVILQGEFL